MSALASARRGWTLIELMIAASLLAIVGAKAAHVLRSGFSVVTEQSTSMAAEDEVHRTMDRIALELMKAQRATLWPSVEGLHSPLIRYRRSLEASGGAADWIIEEIALGVDGRVRWRESPGEPEERAVTWGRTVRPLLEGEIVNGEDDNGNGLIDEDGLSFVVDGDTVTVRLSVEWTESGQSFVQTLERTVRCRN